MLSLAYPHRAKAHASVRAQPHSKLTITKSTSYDYKCTPAGHDTDAPALQLRLWRRAEGTSDPGPAQWSGDRHRHPRHVVKVTHFTIHSMPRSSPRLSA